MPRIAITLGDPAGIGPEVIDQALTSGSLPKGFECIVLGDRIIPLSAGPRATLGPAVPVCRIRLRYDPQVSRVTVASARTGNVPIPPTAGGTAAGTIGALLIVPALLARLRRRA